MLLRFLGQAQEAARVTLASVVRFVRSVQPLRRVLPDRLQHPVAPVREAERLFSTSDCSVSRSASADLFGRLQRAAAGEDGEAGEELLLLV